MKKEHTDKLDRYFQGVKAGTLGRQNERIADMLGWLTPLPGVPKKIFL